MADPAPTTTVKVTRLTPAGREPGERIGGPLGDAHAGVDEDGEQQQDGQRAEQAELLATATQVQLTLTTFFVGMALGQLVGGPVSDQRGRRRPLLLAVAAMTAAIGLRRQH